MDWNSFLMFCIRFGVVIIISLTTDCAIIFTACKIYQKIWNRSNIEKIRNSEFAGELWFLCGNVACHQTHEPFWVRLWIFQNTLEQRTLGRGHKKCTPHSCVVKISVLLLRHTSACC